MISCGSAHTAALVSMGVRGESLSGQLFVWGSSHCVLHPDQISTADDDVLAPRHLQLDTLEEKFENISCGDSFLVALTSEGILMEYGER